LKYSVDANSLIDPWTSRYPPVVFASLWERVDQAIRDGDLKISEVVYLELQGQRDALSHWVKKRESDFVVPIDDGIQERVSEIMRRHPKLVDINNHRSMGDPFVIALAEINGCEVVSEEVPVGPDPNAKRVKIPNVCQARNIGCMKFVEMLVKQSWQF
jgi:hypothetical protein